MRVELVARASHRAVDTASRETTASQVSQLQRYTLHHAVSGLVSTLASGSDSGWVDGWVGCWVDWPLMSGKAAAAVNALPLASCQRWTVKATVGLFACWLLNVPAHSSVSQGRICSDNFTYCHTEIEVASPSHPVTVYWHRANQSQRWPYNLTLPCLAG